MRPDGFWAVGHRAPSSVARSVRVAESSHFPTGPGLWTVKQPLKNELNCDSGLPGPPREAPCLAWNFHTFSYFS